MKTIKLLNDDLMQYVVAGHYRYYSVPSDVQNRALFIYGLLASGGLSKYQIDTLADNTHTTLGKQVDTLADSQGAS